MERLARFSAAGGRRVSWLEFERLSKGLCCRILKTRGSFDVDLIVAINRGGLLLGRLLSTCLNKPLGVISAWSYSGRKRKKIVVDYRVSCNTPVRGNILVVDDLVDSGNTMRKISGFLSKIKGVKRVKTAVLFRKPSSTFEPDFHMKQERRWIVFPYE